MTEIVDLAARRQAKAGFPVPPAEPLQYQMRCHCGCITWSIECHGDPEMATSDTVTFRCARCDDPRENGAVWAQTVAEAKMPTGEPQDSVTVSRTTDLSLQSVLRQLIKDDDAMFLLVLGSEGATLWHDPLEFATDEQRVWLQRQLMLAHSRVCSRRPDVGVEQPGT